MTKKEEETVNFIFNDFIRNFNIKVLTVETVKDISEIDYSLFFTIFIKNENTDNKHIYLEYYLDDGETILTVFEDKEKNYGIQGNLQEVIKQFKEKDYDIRRKSQ